MNIEENLHFGIRALSGFGGRTLLMLLAMSIGIASVVVLTALGEGARSYVINEFSQLGTNLLIVLPGRSETTGGPPPLLGETPRDLTLQDALSLTRSPRIKHVAPLIIGSAPVSSEQRERETNILGSTAELQPVRQLKLAQGRFLPASATERGAAVVVLGDTLKQELFGHRRALGRWVRIGDRRFRVIGLLQAGGESLGADIGEMAIIPVATAQALFNRASLFRILVEAQGRENIPHAEQVILYTIRKRHDNEDDITVITQDAVLTTFDGIFRALTLTVTGIAAISLAVAGILIMNVMLVAVSQRTAEIGLLKALGAPQRQIMQLFLMESALLSLLGAVIGILVAFIAVMAMDQLLPQFTLQISIWALLAAVGVALLTGLLFGVLPARQAAQLDPVLALSGR